MISDDPNFMHPDAPDMPKHITLHRADAYPTQQKQSAIVLPDEQEGHTTAHRQGPKVRHALRGALIPDGYALVNPKTGEKLDADDDLYEHVSHGDTVEVVKA